MIAPARDIQSGGNDAVGWRPGERSFWDMINFMIPHYTAALRLVEQEIVVGWQKVGVLTDDDKKRINQNLEYVLKKADDLDLPTVRNRVERVFTKLRVDPHASAIDIAYEMRIVVESFEDDTKYLYLFAYPREKAKRYIKRQDDWAAALKAFPSISKDIEEAADLYAQGHNLACVFHLMRIMEIGVQRFGKKLGVSLTKLSAKRLSDLTWHQILDALNPKLGAMPQTTRAGRDKHEMYSAIQSYLYSVKDAWRNPTMHPRKDGYTDRETLNILDHVCSFMNELASIVSPKAAP
jgi:hypothetical protein